MTTEKEMVQIMLNRWYAYEPDSISVSERLKIAKEKSIKQCDELLEIHKHGGFEMFKYYTRVRNILVNIDSSNGGNLYTVAHYHE